MLGLIQVKQGCIVMDISGMFSKCFAGGIEVVRVMQALSKKFYATQKRKIKIHLKIIFPPSFFLSLSLYYSSMNLCAYGLWLFR